MSTRDEQAERKLRSREDARINVSSNLRDVPETGRGVTLTLDGDLAHRLGAGDELWLHVPPAGQRGWTYDIEGMHGVVGIDERAEILEGTTHLPAPDGTGFVIRAERPGQVAVRFEPVDGDAGVAPRRLDLIVG